MQTPQYAARRAGEIVLHEWSSYSCFRVTLRLKCFQEESSWISEDLWLDHYDIGNVRSDDLHKNPHIGQTLANAFISSELTIPYRKSVKS